jgi:hypothetical protein
MSDKKFGASKHMGWFLHIDIGKEDILTKLWMIYIIIGEGEDNPGDVKFGARKQHKVHQM